MTLKIMLRAGFLVSALLIITMPSPAAEAIRKFDIGPKGQVLMPGFTDVGPESKYSQQTGYGWLVVPGAFSSYRTPGLPDPLSCDLAAPSDISAGRRVKNWYEGPSFEFRVDVPNGEYQVHVMSGDYYFMFGQAAVAVTCWNHGKNAYDIKMKHQEITANGKRAFYRELTQEELLGEMYHDLNSVLRRDMNAWDRLMEWRVPFRSFRVNVTDGAILLNFTNAAVNAIITYPVAQAKEGDVFMKELRVARRAACPAKDVTPKSEGALPPLPKEAKKKGYLLFVPHWSEDVYRDAIPKEEWIKDEATAFASLGEFESFTFSVCPLKDLEGCNASVSDLKTKDGAILPGVLVDVRVLRYFERKSGPGYAITAQYTLIPYIPLKWHDVSMDKGVNQSYWLTIKVPEDAKPGIYHGLITFKPKNAAESTLKLTFKVLPIKLMPLTDRYQGLWHDYCNYPGGGETQKAICERDIGFNVIHCYGQMNLTYKDGQLGPLDMSDWERKINVFKTNGFPMVMVMSQGASGPAYGATKEPRTDPDYQGSDHAVKTKWSPEFVDCYKKFVRALDDEFKKRKWPDLIFYEGGELANEGERGVQTETQLMKMTHEAGVKNTTSVSGGAMALSLKYSVPYMYMTMIHGINEEIQKAIEAAGSKVALYGPGENRFERGFYFWRSGAILIGEEGLVIDDSGANFFDDLDGVGGRCGDAFPTPEGHAPSVKTFSKREGIDDSKYLFHLEKLIARAEAGESSRAREIAAKARAMLDEIKGGINLDMRYYWEGGEMPAGTVLDLLRYRVAQQIIELEKELK